MLFLKKDFPALQKGVYLDSAATAHKPQVVIDAIANFYANDYATVHRAIYGRSLEATRQYNEGREAVARFLNARSEDEIIFTRGTTDGINLLASTFGKSLKAGDEILLPEIEHHSNLVPWQMVCQERGAKLIPIPVDDDGRFDITKYLSSRTKLVTLAHISNVIGVIQPIKEIIAEAHVYGAKVLIDAAQSAPHLHLDVQDLDVDFLVFSGHKLYGPTGIGILYGQKELLKTLPPYQGGGDMITEVYLDRTLYNDPPLRFEAGTPMIAEVIGLKRAIEYVQEIGLDVIAKHEEKLKDHLLSGLLQHPRIRIFGAKDRGSLVSFVVDGSHPLDLGTLLDLKGIAIRTGHLCSQTAMRRLGVEAVCRASLGLYNTHDDIESFLKALKEVLEKI